MNNVTTTSTCQGGFSHVRAPHILINHQIKQPWRPYLLESSFSLTRLYSSYTLLRVTNGACHQRRMYFFLRRFWIYRAHCAKPRGFPGGSRSNILIYNLKVEIPVLWRLVPIVIPGPECLGTPLKGTVNQIIMCPCLLQENTWLPAKGRKPPGKRNITAPTLWKCTVWFR